MGELLSSLMTGEVQTVFVFFIICLIVLYVLSVVWVSRDAYMRDAQSVLWTIIALIPFLGVIVYCLMRPPMFRIDRDALELEIALKQRELQHYGECAKCGYPIESDYVICPYCHTRLKRMCPSCHHALEAQWKVCPYCATVVERPQRVQQQQRARSAAAVRSSSSARNAVSTRAKTPTRTAASNAATSNAATAKVAAKAATAKAAASKASSRR